MNIDENMLHSSVRDRFKESELVPLNMSNFQDYPGLTSFNYVTTQEISGFYSFLDINIDKIALRVNDENQINEVLFVIKIWDSKKFYEKVVMNYDSPNSLSLSKYFIEKHGLKIPPEIGQDSLENYYSNLPKPALEDFGELQRLVWYDLELSCKEALADMVIKNKTNPSNKFSEKEIWVSFKTNKVSR